MKYLRIITILLLLLLVITPSLAADTAVAIKAGTTTKDTTSIVMDKGSVTFTATDTKLAATTTTLIDGKLFVPETTSEKSTSLVWETTDAKMEYSYTGKTLKETITLKEDKRLSFPITLAKDSKLIPWDNGQWKIVSSVTGNTMEGVILEKPYGIDNKGKRIEMEYTYRDGILNLEYDRTITEYMDGTPTWIGNPVYSEIAYPLLIDPTWVVVGDHEVCTDCVPGYTILRWTSTGTTTWEPPTVLVDYIVVAGGAGGGASRGGGGGAGGVKTGTGLAISGTQTITVGAKGSGGTVINPNNAGNGGNSVFGVAGGTENVDLFTSTGGGKGASASITEGIGGGSGGGSVDNSAVGTAAAGQGNNGGIGYPGTNYGAGGGGGKGSVGGDGTGTVAGNGGSGYDASSFGIGYVAGGGGGGKYADGTAGTGGSSIGGNGGVTTAGFAAVASTGSGGGGGGYSGGLKYGGDGSDGIVLVKYLTNSDLSVLVQPYQSSIYATNVNFTLSVKNASPQNWTFGDTYTSTRRDNVTHFYSVAGNYTATHAVTIGEVFSNITLLFNLTSDVDTNVKSWLHMNGANGGTLFPGEVGSAWVPSSVTTVTATKKFGTASALFNANGDRLSTPSSAVFDFGTGNFTIEQWVYPTSSANNDFIISRTTSGATKADGWGLYHSTASATSDGWVFWAGTAAAGSTGTFSIPLNTWNHVVVQRISGTVNVSVNGIQVAQKTGLSGNYDTVNTIAYGDPVAGVGVNSAKMYLDETRISSAARWNSGGTDYSPPYAEYRGNLLSAYTDLNPNSTARFKTDEPNPANIANITPRNRTVQIQYFENATNISVTVAYNPQHVFASYVYANKTMFPDVNVTYVSYDNALGQVRVNVTRPSGFYTGGFTDSRASIFDIRMVYWNYTPVDEVDTNNYQYFVNGYQRNGTTGYEFPIHNFITTNVTFRDWETFSNFTIKDKFVGNQTLLLPSENNFTANRWTWDFGDGTPIIIGNESYPEPHTYAASGIYNISSTAYLWQNTSVTNTTYLTANITYPLNYVKADFTCTPLQGSTGLFVFCTDYSIFGSTAYGKTYNWSFGDTLGSLSPFSDTIGSASHVYAALGTFTVALRVNNTEKTDTMTRLNYITISNNQQSQTTFYSPHQVDFYITDINYNRLVNVTVSANAIESTLPGGLSGALVSLRNAYGITDAMAQLMLNSTTSMTGHTDNTGGISFLLLSTIGYRVNITDDSGITYTSIVYPQDIYYNLRTSNGSYTQPQNVISNYNANSYDTLNVTEPDIYNVTMQLFYYDSLATTDEIQFWVKSVPNDTFINHQNVSILNRMGPVLLNYTVPNIRGEQWRWGYDAHRI